MAQAAWEKPIDAKDPRLAQLTQPKNERLKFLIGGLLILAAVGYLIVSGTLSGQQFFITVEEALNNPDYAGQTVQITGAVIGSTIKEETIDGKYTITFTVANMPIRTHNLAETLNIASNDPNALKLKVFVQDQAKPELLRHEAQAIMTGKIGEDGVFYATQLQFKCPSRFEEAGPNMGEQDHPGMKALEINAG